MTLTRNLTLAILAALLLAEGFAAPKFVVEGWQMQDGLPSDNIRNVVQTRDGYLWVGTLGSGVARLQGGVVSRWRQSDGLVSDFVLSLQAEPEGSVWAGTYGHGLSRIQGGRCATVSSRHGLPSDVIFSLLDDEQGHFWMSSPAGIFRVAKADLHRCADGQLDRVPCVVLDLSDGLATLEMAGDCQPVSCRTADGRLWFATAKVLARVNPADVQARSKPLAEKRRKKPKRPRHNQSIIHPPSFYLEPDIPEEEV